MHKKILTSWPAKAPAGSWLFTSSNDGDLTRVGTFFETEEGDVEFECEYGHITSEMGAGEYFAACSEHDFAEEIRLDAFWAKVRHDRA